MTLTFSGISNFEVGSDFPDDDPSVGAEDGLLVAGFRALLAVVLGDLTLGPGHEGLDANAGHLVTAGGTDDVVNLKKEKTKSTNSLILCLYFFCRGIIIVKVII